MNRTESGPWAGMIHPAVAWSLPLLSAGFFGGGYYLLTSPAAAAVPAPSSEVFLALPRKEAPVLPQAARTESSLALLSRANGGQVQGAASDLGAFPARAAAPRPSAPAPVPPPPTAAPLEAYHALPQSLPAAVRNRPQLKPMIKFIASFARPSSAGRAASLGASAVSSTGAAPAAFRSGSHPGIKAGARAMGELLSTAGAQSVPAAPPVGPSGQLVW